MHIAPAAFLLSSMKSDINQYIANFLHEKLSFEELKKKLYELKAQYIAQAPRKSDTGNTNLIPVEEALLQ